MVVADLSPSLLAYPQVLPGAGARLLTSGALGGADQTTIEVLSLKDGSRKVVGRWGTAARYLPNGYIVYVKRRYSVRRGLRCGPSGDAGRPCRDPERRGILGNVRLCPD
jgi:hypothetical protein